MKIKWDKRYIAYGITAFIVIACSILFYILIEKFDVVASIFQSMINILMPIIVGLIIAYLLNPLMNFFENVCYKRVQKNKQHSRLRRGLSLISTFILALLFVSGLFYLVIPQIVVSVSQLISNIPIYFDNSKDFLNELVKNNKFLSDVIDNNTFNFMDNLQKIITQYLPLANDIITNVTNSAIGVVTGVMNIILGCIVAIYVLYSKEKFGGQSKKVMFALFPKKFTVRFLDIVSQTDRMFSSFIFGKFLDSLIVGILCFIGMTILQIPYAMLIAVIITVFNMIPFFGPIIGAVPCTLLILMVDPFKALWFVILIAVLQQLDGNVLGPMILGNQTGLSGFWITFAIITFGGLFGFIGMIIGVPTFAVIYSLIRLFVENRLKSKGMPVSTAEYIKPIRAFTDPDIPPTEMVILEEKSDKSSSHR